MHEDGRPEPAGEPPGRLTKRVEFQRVSRGSRISVETFTLQSRRREGTERDAASARIGLTVTKTVGGAVERNRIRRRLKEALRAASPLEAEGDHDYVLMARREALGRQFAALVNDVRDAFRAARRRETDSRERRSASGRQRAKTGEHELRGYQEPLSRDRAVDPGDGRLAVFLRRSSVAARAPGADAGRQSGSEKRGPDGRRAGRVAPGDRPPDRRRRGAETVSEALAASSRVAIDTPSLGGSIDLKGGKLDDLVLKDYRETISKESPLIRLFSPPGAPDAYWAETGFVSASGVKTPNLDTLWTADAKTLTPERPVALTWDNGAGLVFKRVIAVDDKYMFTIADSVANSGAAPATLRPYGLILRRGKPNVAGYSVLHEGFVGVITGDGGGQVGLTLPVQEVTYSAIDKDTGKVRAFKGVGGWLGFTDKYWGSAVIPEQTAPIDARFSASGRHAAGGLPGRFPGKGANGRAGGCVRDDDPRIRRRQRGQYDRQLRVQARHQEVLPDDRLGLVLDDHDPDVPASRRDLQGRRQFRRRNPHRHCARQARLLPARQSLIQFNGENEEDSAEDRRVEGALPRRSRQAAARADGAVQARGGQSRSRLPADGDPDPGVLCALQGHLHHHRDAPRAVLRLDQGFPRPIRPTCSRCSA